MKRNFAVLPDGICLIGLLLLCFLTACRDDSGREMSAISGTLSGSIPEMADMPVSVQGDEEKSHMLADIAGNDGGGQEFPNEFEVRDNMLIHYNGCRPEVVVPDGIVLIASEAFSGNEQLVSVYLPEGVKTISDEAFMGCTNLRSVLLPTSLTDIGMRAFAGCSSLEEINLQQVRYFHSEGFLNCTALKTVELTEVRELYFGVFYNSGLEEVVGMGYLEKVDDLVFGETPWLTGYLAGNGPDMLAVQNVLWSGYRCVGEVIIPDGIEIIAPRAFQYADGITSVVCGGSVREIGEYAFSGCSQLKRFWMDDSVVRLGKACFSSDAGLSDVRLSNRLEYLPDFLFSECYELKCITIPENCGVSGTLLNRLHYAGRRRKYTVPPQKKVFSFLKDNKQVKNKVYMTELAEDSEWLQAAEKYGFELLLLELEDEEVALGVGGQYQLAFNSGAKAYWNSADEEIVSVDCDGILTAKRLGTTVVTATIYGKEYRCQVTVKE